MSSLAVTMRQFTIKTRMRGAIAMVLALLGMIALVEQSAAAADSLKRQAARLSEVVGTFKLEPVLAAN